MGVDAAARAPRSVRQSLREGLLPALEVRMLWQHVLDVDRAWLFRHDADVLAEGHWDAFSALRDRRLAGEPMAYILGWREFYGRRFEVGPGVLIPRPETEVLVERALEVLRPKPKARVLDLGTGSGIVAITLALECVQAEVWATDVSTAALDMARRNAAALGARLGFLLGNWYDTKPEPGSCDLIVSNPPYIAAHDAHLSQGDLRFEPPAALTDGADGLQALRRIVQGASGHLRVGGVLCVEHGWDQSVAVRSLFRACGFSGVASGQDLAGIERITWGRLSA